MFSAPAPSGQASDAAPRSLFQVIGVGDVSSASSKIQEDGDMTEQAAKQRIAKADRANAASVHQQASSDRRPTDLYDDKDKTDFEDDVDNILDVTDMGEDAKSRAQAARNLAAKKSGRGDYTDILDGEHIEPLNMKSELRNGEIGLYGEMRKPKRRRGGDEEDPSELAGTDGVFKKKDKRKEENRRRRRLATGESDSESDDDAVGPVNDTEENEELNAEDAWLAAATKDDDSGIYHGKDSKSKSSQSEANVPPYLKDQNLALQELQAMLKEGPSGENVLRLVKRLSPSSNAHHSNKKAKTGEKDVPTTNPDATLAKEELAAKKAVFEKCVAIADFLMDSGYTTVYEATYEDVSNRLNPKAAKLAKKAEEEGLAAEQIEQGQDGAFWQYKWGLETPEVFGPFDSESIKGWAAAFSAYPDMVIRGGSSPAAVATRGPSEAWTKFEPFLWS